MSFKKLASPCALAVVAAFSLLGFMSTAQAAGTLAGTSISNTANLNFSIGSVAQNALSSNTVSFVVDNKVNLVVTEENGVPTNATPGGTGFITKFKVTNLGNSPQDYGLYAVETFANGTALFGKTTNFNVGTGACTAYADSTTGTVGSYDAGDTAKHIANLAPDSSRFVFLSCNMPATRVNGDFAVVSLYARTHNPNTGFGSAPVSQTASANTAGIDIVFADIAGPDDGARDGSFSARSGYLIQAPTLTVVKTSTPICDPFNFNVNPKNIPGAYVRYAVSITNGVGAGSSANLGTLSDALALANLTFDPNLIAPTGSSCDAATPPESAAGSAFKLSCTGGTRACVATPVYKTGAADADGFDFTSPNITANLTTGLPAETGYTAGELKAGESVKFEFNVLVK